MPLEHHREGPILGQASLRDVQLREDLDARDHGQVQTLGWRRDLVECPVDAVAKAELALARLDVDVAGALFDGLMDDEVDQPNDRGFLGRFLEAIQTEHLVLPVSRRTPLPRLSHLIRLADRVFEPAVPIEGGDGRFQIGFRRHDGVDFTAGQAAEVVHGGEIQGIHAGNRQGV